MARKVVDLTIRLKDGVSGVLGKIRGGIKGAVSAFRKLAKSVGIAGIAFGAFVADAAKFNVAMARVWTMAGGGVENFKRLRGEARALASEFGLARASIAEGMYNALSAGVDEANLQKVMKVAAQVAVADGSTISTAIDGITTVMNAFKISSADANKVADDLFKTVALGKTTFGELASTLSTVAPVAAATGVPLKEILAHVAALTSQGVPTAQAMTQIRASIIGLNKALGDGWSDTMTYQEALRKIWRLSGESQTKLTELVGSVEAVGAVLGGVGINADMAAAKLGSMADSAGAAQSAFEKVDQFRHWPTLIETARAQLSRFFEVINERIAPAVEKISALITRIGESGVLERMAENVADKLQIAAKAVQIMIKGGKGQSEVLGAVGNVIKQAFKSAATTAIEVLAKYAPFIGKAIASGVMDLLGIKTKAVRQQQRRASDASTAYANELRFGTKTSQKATYDKLQEELKKLKDIKDSEGSVTIEGTDSLQGSIDNLKAVMAKFDDQGIDLNPSDGPDGLSGAVESATEKGTEKGVKAAMTIANSLRNGLNQKLTGSIYEDDDKVEEGGGITEMNPSRYDVKPRTGNLDPFTKPRIGNLSMGGISTAGIPLDGVNKGLSDSDYLRQIADNTKGGLL